MVTSVTKYSPTMIETILNLMNIYSKRSTYGLSLRGAFLTNCAVISSNGMVSPAKYAVRVLAKIPGVLRAKSVGYRLTMCCRSAKGGRMMNITCGLFVFITTKINLISSSRLRATRSTLWPSSADSPETFKWKFLTSSRKSSAVRLATNETAPWPTHLHLASEVNAWRPFTTKILGRNESFAAWRMDWGCAFGCKGKIFLADPI